MSRKGLWASVSQATAQSILVSLLGWKLDSSLGGVRVKGPGEGRPGSPGRHCYATQCPDSSQHGGYLVPVTQTVTREDKGPGLASPKPINNNMHVFPEHFLSASPMTGSLLSHCIPARPNWLMKNHDQKGQLCCPRSHTKWHSQDLSPV